MIEQLESLENDLCKLERWFNKFNIFKILDIEQNELIHSNFLAWLLDPTAHHGFKDLFVKGLLNKLLHIARNENVQNPDLPTINDVSGWSFEESKVLREKQIEAVLGDVVKNGRIDILIQNDACGFLCVIENKIKSNEHGNQLATYKEGVKKRFPKHKKRIFVYLSVFGDNPDSEYIPLSYSEIVELIEQIVDKESKIGDKEVYFFISHYIELLKRQIMQPNETQRRFENFYFKHENLLEKIYKSVKDWTPERFFGVLKEQDEKAFIFARNLYQWGQEQDGFLEVTLGTGKRGSINFKFKKNNRLYKAFLSVHPDAKLSLHYGWLTDNKVPEEKLKLLHSRILEIPVLGESEVINRQHDDYDWHATVKITEELTEQLEQIKSILLWFVSDVL